MAKSFNQINDVVDINHVSLKKFRENAIHAYFDIMKTIVVFAICLVVAQALTDEQKEKLKKHKAECLSETKVDEELVNKLKTGDYKTENEALKKYALCMLIKSELMTKEGKFKKDVALAKVTNPADKVLVEKLIDSCLTNKGNTPHQTAWNYVKCYHEKDPKHAIFL